MARLPEASNNVPDKCFAADYSGAQTNADIITPTSGRKIKVLSVFASSEVNNVDVTIAFKTSGNVIFKLYTNLVAATSGNVICATGAVDELVKLTCGAGTFVSIAYKEVS